MKLEEIITLDNLVRDLTTARVHPKSEVRTRIAEFILNLLEEVKIEEIKEDTYLLGPDFASKGYNVAVRDFKSKINQALKERGIL